MPFRHAREILDYWQSCPPENEMLVMLAQVYTSWKPREKDMTTADEHQASLEARWRAGAMNAKQLVDAMGGAKVVAVRADGIAQPAQIGGIGPFPGAH